MNDFLKFLLVVIIAVIKVVTLLLIIIILALLPNDAKAQNAKSKNNAKELNIYARVKDHITHLDVDSTVCARLLSASDSSFIDSMKIQKARKNEESTLY